MTAFNERRRVQWQRMLAGESVAGDVKDVEAFRGITRLLKVAAAATDPGVLQLSLKERWESGEPGDITGEILMRLPQVEARMREDGEAFHWARKALECLDAAIMLDPDYDYGRTGEHLRGDRIP